MREMIVRVCWVVSITEPLRTLGQDIPSRGVSSVEDHYLRFTLLLCVVLCDWRFYKGSSLALDDPAPPGHLEGGSTLIYGSRNSSPGLTRISLPSSSYVRNAHSAEVPRENICFVPVYCIMSKSPSAGLQTYWWQDLQARLTFTFS